MVIETTFTARVKGLRERYSRGAAMVAPVEVGEGGCFSSRIAVTLGRAALVGGGVYSGWGLG